jgi:hypothetical protein
MRKTLLSGLFALLALAVVLTPAGAQERRSLRFEKTVTYKTGRLIDLNATVGPVRIANVQFSEPRGGGTVVDRIRSGGGPSETETLIQASFDTENPEEEEWVVTFTLDFLDSRGRLIDRVVESEGFEGESDVFEVNHAILTYVLPLIDRVEVRLEAKLD